MTMNEPNTSDGATSQARQSTSLPDSAVVSATPGNSAPAAVNMLSKATLTIEESPQELRFRADRYTGRMVRYLGPALPGALVLASGIPFYRFSAFVFPVLLVAALALYRIVQKRIKPFESTTLSVDALRFQATGDGVGTMTWTGFLSEEVVVPVEEITSFLFIRNTEDGPDGIWVNLGFWKSKCVLPGINRDQGAAVVAAIVRKFPALSVKIK